MKLSYRFRRRSRRFSKGLCIFLLIFLFLYGIWVLWSQRYVRYTRDGAVLDFGLPQMEPGQVVERPEEGPKVEIEEQAPQELAPEDSGTLPKVLGYYADAGMLAEDVEAVQAAVEELPAGTAVMLDLKNEFGSFFYSSHIPGAETSGSVDTGAVDQLIKKLSSGDLYLIARIPALRDRAYGLAHQSSGLALSSGALWEDPNGCYWLDPASADTMAYLEDIVEELQVLGFDEVVFTDFSFPETESIVYAEGVSKDDLIAQAAESLVKQCARGNFVLSFQGKDPQFPLPEGRSRLYLTGVEADQAAQIAQTATVDDPAVNLVFLAAVNDTRYDEFGVLRPILHTPQDPE